MLVLNFQTLDKTFAISKISKHHMLVLNTISPSKIHLSVTISKHHMLVLNKDIAEIGINTLKFQNIICWY